MSDKTEKLRPEQRKLFRRIFLTAFDTGATVEEATAMADRAVVAWEARGAFEADLPAPTMVPHGTLTTWEAFSNVVARMLNDGRETEQIAELRVAYPDEFDFMRELGALMVAKPVESSDIERLFKLRQVMESGTAAVCIDGIPAGFVTYWNEIHLPDRPVTKLCLTVEASFSLLT